MGEHIVLNGKLGLLLKCVGLLTKTIEQFVVVQIPVTSKCERRSEPLSVTRDRERERERDRERERERDWWLARDRIHVCVYGL